MTTSVATMAPPRPPPPPPPPSSVVAPALISVALGSDADAPIAGYDEHEDAVRRQPHAIHAWLAFLTATAEAPRGTRERVFERALGRLPRSYKLWKLYVDEFHERHVRGRRVDGPDGPRLLALYERALAQLPTMPRLWLDYLAALHAQRRITHCRRALDRALRALPVTQHHRLWAPMREYMADWGAVAPRTVRALYRRLLELAPDQRDAYVTYLTGTGQWAEASRELVRLLDEALTATTTTPPSAKTTHRRWMALCDMVSQHPTDVAPTLDVERILRSGMAQFSDEVGRLWGALAAYFVRLGLFERARDVYEEGIATVLTVRDFSVIFDAYVQFIEAMLTTEMELAEAPVQDQDGQDQDRDVDHQRLVDRWLKIYEDVAERRPLLLNSVLLRQNPHNVREWEKRVELHQRDPQQVIRTFAEAVQTVDPFKAGGRLPGLWVKFARFYEDKGRPAEARAVFTRAVAVDYRSEQELAALHCAWADMELRLEHFDEALAIVRRACAVPASVTTRLRQKTALSTKDKLHRCVKLWTLRLDLEESLGDVASTRAAYDDAFELQIITVQMVLNYAAFLEEHAYFEEAFRVYERGLALFPKFPHALELWSAYLTKFVRRYAGTKVERARDLHEQAIRAAPPAFARALFVKYGDFEERHGMLRNVMTVYERAAEAVPEDERLDVYVAYVKKAHKFFGVAKVREVYQWGIEKLADKYVAPLCLQFAEMETKLGEFERARAIYAHASQFCDPRLHEESFWKVWHDFEVAHGSEHTFLEMLRIKRSVVAQYSTVNYISAEIAPQVAPDANGNVNGTGMVPASTATGAHGDAMAALEASVVSSTETHHDEVTGKRALGDDGDEIDATTAGRNVRQKVIEVTNDEEIELEDEEDEEDDEAGADIEERAMPATLYGNVKK